MIYLREINLPSKKPEKWPFTMNIFNELTNLKFDVVTFIAGDNGSGKSTLVESLSLMLKMPSVGKVDTVYDENLAHIRPFANMMKPIFSKRPRSKFFLRSEDFYNFVLKLKQEKKELISELARVDVEYKNKSQFTKNQARSAYEGSKYAMTATYGEDVLQEASHGESYLRLFQSRITPNGLYILDEPEVPLSALRQLSLLHIIKTMSEKENCQFIISTHSPILLAYEKATIYNLDDKKITPVKWSDLESVQLLKDFLDAPNRYIERL